jgi:hypothetical protein
MRPPFPDVVDELLAIEKDLPDVSYTEVCVLCTAVTDVAALM